MTRYYIIVTWRDPDVDPRKEIVDEAENKQEAIELRESYKVAYKESYINLTARPEKGLKRTKAGRELISDWNS
jgi:hypothetical protein